MKILQYALILLPLGTFGQGLHITPGADWIVNGSPKLVLNNAGLVNNGNFEAGTGAVVFTGDAATFSSTIGGDRPIRFYDLVVGKSFNDLQLNNDAVITGSIILNSGNLQLNNYTLDLGNTGTIVGENNHSYITGISGGTIKKTAVLNTPQAVNPGNIGVEITSQARLGSTVITRGHVQQSNPSGQSGIQRYFDITPEMNSDLQATLRFFYLDGELAGKDKNDLTVFASREGRNDWASRGKDKSDIFANWIVKNNISELHRFTLAIPNGGKPFGQATSWQIFPNPSSGTFRTTLVCEAVKARVVNLYDLKGHLIESKTIYCQAGVNTIEWNTSHLAAGSYYLAAEGLPTAAIQIVR
ncbi:MAG TPA: T9SS type A sorting domain-containing protein [Puia sp.]|nr:T9SS type A sorting domain-containing protein [Puia sp.]